MKKKIFQTSYNFTVNKPSNFPQLLQLKNTCIINSCKRNVLATLENSFDSLKSIEDLYKLIDLKHEQVQVQINYFIDNFEEIVHKYPSQSIQIEINERIISSMKNEKLEEVFYEYIHHKTYYFKESKNEIFNPKEDEFLNTINVKILLHNFIMQCVEDNTLKLGVKGYFRSKNWINWSKKNVSEFLNTDNIEILLDIFNNSLRDKFRNYINEISHPFIKNDYSDYELNTINILQETEYEKIDINTYTEKHLKDTYLDLHYAWYYDIKWIDKSQRLNLESLKILLNSIYKSYIKDIETDDYRIIDDYFSFSDKITSQEHLPIISKDDYIGFIEWIEEKDWELEKLYKDILNEAYKEDLKKDLQYKTNIENFIKSNVIFSINPEKYIEDLDFIEENFKVLNFPNNGTIKNLLDFIEHYTYEFEEYLLGKIEKHWWIEYLSHESSYLNSEIWDIDYSNLWHWISETLFIKSNLLRFYCQELIKENYDEFNINSSLHSYIFPDSFSKNKNEVDENLKEIILKIYKRPINKDKGKDSCHIRDWVVSVAFFHNTFNNILGLDKDDFDRIYEFIKVNFSETFEKKMFDFISLIPNNFKDNSKINSLIRLWENSIEMKRENLFNLFLSQNPNIIGSYFEKDYIDKYNISILAFIRLIKYFKNNQKFLKYFKEQHKIEDDNKNVLLYRK